MISTEYGAPKFFMENLKSMIMMGVVGLILLGLVYFMVSYIVCYILNNAIGSKYTTHNY